MSQDKGPEACPMASTCHLLPRATFVDITASMEPRNLAVQLAPVLDPEGSRLFSHVLVPVFLGHGSYLLPSSWRLSLVPGRLRTKKGFVFPACNSLPPPLPPRLLDLQLRSQPGKCGSEQQNDKLEGPWPVPLSSLFLQSLSHSPSVARPFPGRTLLFQKT